MNPGVAHAPSLFLPGVLGAATAASMWERLVGPVLAGPLARADRTALLCAALERPGGEASPLHATGLSLVGQSRRPEGLVDLAAAWRALLVSPGGRDVLEASLRAGAGGPPPEENLVRRAESHLGARVPAWRDILLLAAGAESLWRLAAGRVPASSDSRLEPWLARVVQARDVLDEAGLLLP